jgi:hypothetical protein
MMTIQPGAIAHAKGAGHGGYRQFLEIRLPPGALVTGFAMSLK